MAVVADWRKETDPRKCAALESFHGLLSEAAASGESGRIIVEPLPYWPSGFGLLEAGRTVKRDLTKVGGK